jgi:hypothetical protein
MVAPNSKPVPLANPALGNPWDDRSTRSIPSDGWPHVPPWGGAAAEFMAQRGRKIPDVEVIEGFHQQHESKVREEKQTDINIAVELLDAVNGECTRAILITGDIDQALAMRAARERCPLGRRVEVDVWVPPRSIVQPLARGGRRALDDLSRDHARNARGQPFSRPHHHEVWRGGDVSGRVENAKRTGGAAVGSQKADSVNP